MAWISGVPRSCLNPACNAPPRALRLVGEVRVEPEAVIVGAVECSTCGARSGYSRRPPPEAGKIAAFGKARAGSLDGRVFGTENGTSRQLALFSASCALGVSPIKAAPHKNERGQKRSKMPTKPRGSAS